MNMIREFFQVFPYKILWSCRTCVGRVL